MGLHKAFPPGQEMTCSLQPIAKVFNLDPIKIFLLHNRVVEIDINILLNAWITAV